MYLMQMLMLKIRLSLYTLVVEPSLRHLQKSPFKFYFHSR